MSITNTMAGISPYIPVSSVDNFTTTASNQLQTGGLAATAVTDNTLAAGNDSGRQDQTISSFGTILNNILSEGQGDKIDEEQLFSALLEERLTTLKGDDLASTYNQYFESHKREMARTDGYVPVESAARGALQDMVTEGLLSTEEAEEIHSQAFQAAQFDGNSGALYDSIGTTMAVTLVELAMQSASAMMTRFDSDELEAGRLSLDYTQNSGPARFDGTAAAPISSQAASFVGGDGFLFKPTSEKNGNLAVLLPSAMSGRIADVSLFDASGQVLGSGDEYGNFDDGRPIFRFDQPGRSYPANTVVTVAMIDGSEQRYTIPNPSQRYE